jgi:outer membrane receptor for ferrienterochelin and colicin
MSCQIITEAGLQKLACCNIGESFESNATVDVGFTDAVSGAKKIKMLGLDGKYSQFMFENIPFMRTLESGFSLSHIPGPFMESIQVSKGTSSVLNGYESTTGQINVEYKKPKDSEIFYLNLFANTEGRYESNITSGLVINEKLSTGLFFHGSMQNMPLDHNSDGFYDKPLTNQLNFMNRWEYIHKDLVHIQFGIELLEESRVGGQLEYEGKNESPDGVYGIDININKFRVFSKIGFAFPEKPNQSLGWINSFTMFDQQSVFGNRDYNGEVKSLYSNLIFQTIIGSNTNHKVSSGLSFQYDDYNELFIDINRNRKEVVPGIFSQYTWSIPEKSVLMAGLRADLNSIHGLLLTPRLHWKYNMNEHYILRATLGKAYRSANIFSENQSLLANSRTFYMSDEFEIESAWNYGGSLSRHFTLPNQREASLTLDFYRTDFQDQVVVDIDHSSSEVHIFNLEGNSY